MPLSNEDNLRINVLLRQNLYALRIDESKMLIDALTERGEGQVIACSRLRRGPRA